MKLDVAVNEVVLSNVGAAGEFRIRNSAKAFKILSDGLYSNKIRAIVRELSCNAVDSHVGAGKADVPFEVHLPSVMEPWFAVRDFGLGLSGDAVVNIYTTYFESTKTDSNDYIGALGLGSKSPFSYTENFTVTAIKDGTKRIYSAFINDVGVPSIVEMSEELTDEGNGVEVKFSVTDRYDYNTFRNEAHHVFSWFKLQPTITGIDGFVHQAITYKEKNVVPGVHVRDNGYQCSAVMGNISYPLNNVPEAQKHFGELCSLLECGLIMEFEIGELDFAASREELSYVPLTIRSIKAKLESLNANLAVHLAVKANLITGEWERAQYLSQEFNTMLYRAAVIKYIADTKFPLFDITSYHGKKEFTYKVADLEARKLTLQGFRTRAGSCSKINERSEYVGGLYVKTMHIPCEMDVVIVLNDLKTGCLARARFHFGSHHYPKSALVYCVSHADADLAVRQLEYDKFVGELHNPPVVIKASELQKPVRAKAMSTQGIMTLTLKSANRRGYADSYAWTPHHDAIDENETYYYVCLSNFDSIYPDGRNINMTDIKSCMDECGISDISGIKVFGVRKSRIKEIAELDNWVWIEDKIKEETAKVTDTNIASLVVAEMLDSYYNKVYTNTKVAELVGPDSYYAKYVAEYGAIKRVNGNVTQLVQLCGQYGKAVQVETIRKKIEDTKTGLYKKYPLLKYFKDSTGVTSSEVATYIMMVDKQEKN
jgi:hypothetical protein